MSGFLAGRTDGRRKVETQSTRCPLERQMPGDVELAVSVSMETRERTQEKRDHIKTLLQR